MTDEEIIKALECCNNNQHCWLCVLKDREDDCYEILKYALDLINRQKAEIDKLKIENCALSEKRITFPERLKIVKHARTKSIKEFADRLIEKKMQSTMDRRICTTEMINNLVKEMTESEVE